MLQDELNEPVAQAANTVVENDWVIQEKILTAEFAEITPRPQRRAGLNYRVNHSLSPANTLPALVAREPSGRIQSR